MIGYDQPGTWTTLYNILFQKVIPGLGSQPVPDSDIARACLFYKGRTLDFGLPLESLRESTKSDWLQWMAAVCPQSQFQ